MHIAVPERAYTETDHPMQFIGKFAVGDVVDHVDGGWPARVLWGRATSKQEEMYDVELLDGDCRGEIRILAGDSLVPLSRAA